MMADKETVHYGALARVKDDGSEGREKFVKLCHVVHATCKQMKKKYQRQIKNFFLPLDAPHVVRGLFIWDSQGEAKSWTKLQDVFVLEHFGIGAVNGRDDVFFIFLKKHKYQFVARSKRERDEWVRILQQEMMSRSSSPQKTKIDRDFATSMPDLRNYSPKFADTIRRKNSEQVQRAMYDYNGKQEEHYSRVTRRAAVDSPGRSSSRVSSEIYQHPALLQKSKSITPDLVPMHLSYEKFQNILPTIPSSSPSPSLRHIARRVRIADDYKSCGSSDDSSSLSSYKEIIKPPSRSASLPRGSNYYSNPAHTGNYTRAQYRSNKNPNLSSRSVSLRIPSESSCNFEDNVSVKQRQGHKTAAVENPYEIIPTSSNSIYLTPSDVVPRNQQNIPRLPPRRRREQSQ